MDKIQNCLAEKTSNKYQLHKQLLLNPRIKIIGNFPDENIQELEDRIIKQNFSDLEGSYFKVLHLSNNPQKQFSTLFAEVNKIIYSYLAINKRISVQFRKFKIYDDFNILRCFKCCHYGHSKKICKEEEICYKCSSQHNSSECNENENVKKCTNCIYSNDNYKTEFDFNHYATDVSCPVLKIMINKKIKITDYENNPQLQ